MNKANLRYQNMASTPVRQRGMLTTFTGVMILVLLTLMMFFAIRVGVFEQRVSANDSRQKLAFHTAESGISHAKEFFLANSVFLATLKEDFVPDTTVDKVDGEWPKWFDGWLADTSEKRWQSCADWEGSEGIDFTVTDSLTPAQLSHPCFGEANPDQRARTYYYSFDSSTGAAPTANFEDFTKLDLGTDSIIPGTTETVSVEALLCVLEIKDDRDADVPVEGCALLNTPVVPENDAGGNYFMLTLLARGESDCVGTTCNAEALISEQVSNFGATGGGNSPDVPLTTKSSFPPSGTAEVVPNPNAGGIGVPISVWMNANDCSAGAAVDPSSGSWATCEMHEWYGVDKKPDDMACSGTCACTEAESLSFTDANTNKLGIDLVLDPDFPCDLFQFYFGIPRDSYEIVKGYSKIISDCDSLDENSFGIYWVSGSECKINSNTIIGSVDNPVLLISAATTTTFNGGANFYGVLFATDVEDPAAELNSIGTNTVYGSVINDAVLGSYNGTFQVVWAEDVSEKAGNGGGLGSVLGGWSDFHEDWE
jgi:parallel beta-helix repeat protein